MTTMTHPVLHSTLSQLDATTKLFIRSLNGIRQDQALVRPGPSSNPMLWVAGHLVQARTQLLRAFGPPRQLPWENLFATGSMIGEATLYPSIGEVEAVWSSASAELVRRLEGAPPNRYDESAPDWLVSRDGTLGGAINYAVYHEAYHVGQLGYIRKWLGYEPVFEPVMRVAIP
jgi:uncharacterized damage-inducible protein DinB